MPLMRPACRLHAASVESALPDFRVLESAGGKGEIRMRGTKALAAGRNIGFGRSEEGGGEVRSAIIPAI